MESAPASPGFSGFASPPDVGLENLKQRTGVISLVQLVSEQGHFLPKQAGRNYPSNYIY